MIQLILYKSWLLLGWMNRDQRDELQSEVDVPAYVLLSVSGRDQLLQLLLNLQRQCVKMRQELEDVLAQHRS